MSGGLAHGKVILFGEHAAVYDRPAVAVGIPDAMQLLGTRHRTRGLRVRVEPWDLDADATLPGTLGECLETLERLLPSPDGGLEVSIRARIPARAGLGSSAALSVALVRAVARAQGVDLEEEAVRGLAHRLENVFHGGASGLDDTVATHGGTCLFRRSGFGADDAATPAGRRLSEQAIQLELAVPDLLFVDSGVERSTRAMVAGVRRRWEADREAVEALFDGMEDSLRRGIAGLRCGDPAAVGRAMDDNQSLLAALGVSHPALEELIAAARNAGALGAKLTGAGGGGGVIALAPGREDAVLDAWRACKREGMRLGVGSREGAA